MLKPSAKVVMLHARDSERALENLNRITGLRFSRWPESLVATATEAPVASDQLRQGHCAEVGQALA
ncbi:MULTISPECIES: hypothetical protein [Pseudomonas]|uniref:Uncharacterized protein n=1 Tax=Pseudomonas fulva (strain 12-X) TaxID=743720 RepID=F6AG86_PSEF1|nr:MULTISPECIES: hypothetical protein [Pseudomonas]AEF21488.1 hypothetical protein Psefu_1512 [Pseudomonas fulva 12-X]PZW68944.1 hypothetical protein F471_02258 [Pseudomonas sp. URMO17WK12:I1]